MSLWSSRRTRHYFVLVAVTTIGSTLLYNYGMATWENDPQPLFRSLGIVFQSFTTTGYGEDAGWSTPQMYILTIGLQLMGIGLILTAVDVFAVPWLSKHAGGHAAVGGSRPRGSRRHLRVHVSWRGVHRGPESRGEQYVVIESDEETARTLHEDEYRVVYGDPESTTVLENAGIGRATAVVADSADDTNASIVPPLARPTRCADRDIGRGPSPGEYHEIAGADEVLSPRQLLGESLAHRVPTAVTTAVDEGSKSGRPGTGRASIAEGATLRTDCSRSPAARTVRRRRNRCLDRRRIRKSDSARPRARRGMRLLVAGKPGRIETLRSEAMSTVQPFRPSTC